MFGGDIDGYNSYAWRGNLPVVEDVMEAGMAIWPGLGRIRMLRQWGGLMDMSMDGSPIIDRTAVGGLYLNCGWCYGGFKATPASGWCFAHLIARDEPYPGGGAAAARPLRDRRADRRARRRRPAEPALRTRRCVFPVPIAVRAAMTNSPIWVTRRCSAPILHPPDAAATFHDYVYLRDNPSGIHRELWYHGGGCRKWLVVTRNTRTHEISDVKFADAGGAP